MNSDGVSGPKISILCHQQDMPSINIVVKHLWNIDIISVGSDREIKHANSTRLQQSHLYDEMVPLSNRKARELLSTSDLVFYIAAMHDGGHELHAEEECLLDLFQEDKNFLVIIAQENLKVIGNYSSLIYAVNFVTQSVADIQTFLESIALPISIETIPCVDYADYISAFYGSKRLSLGIGRASFDDVKNAHNKAVKDALFSLALKNREVKGVVVTIFGSSCLGLEVLSEVGDCVNDFFEDSREAVFVISMVDGLCMHENEIKVSVICAD